MTVSNVISFIPSTIDSVSAGLGIGLKTGVIMGMASQALSDKTLLLANAYDSTIAFPEGYHIVDITAKEMAINAALFLLLGEGDFSKGIKSGIAIVTFNQVVFIVAARMIEHAIHDLRLPRSRSVSFSFYLKSFVQTTSACFLGSQLAGIIGVILAANICMLIASTNAPRGGAFRTSPLRPA